MRTSIIRLLIMLALMLSASHLPARAGTTTTNVCGAINADITWLLANSPYAVCVGGVTVAPGVTLTIEPGTVVQFEASIGNKLNVQGAINAIGTLTQPITFTGVVTTPGSWAGFSADGSAITPALVNLSYITLDYGGLNGFYGAQIYADQAVITITHSIVRNGGGNGIYAATPARVAVQDTSFINNGRNAIYLSQPASDWLMTDLSATGNSTDAVFIGGSTALRGERKWGFTGLPYVVDGVVSNQVGDVLTIDPGNEIQFMTTGWLNIGGRLDAIGLPGTPITFTGQTKAPGAWRGVSVSGSALAAASANLEHAVIEFGGSGIGGTNVAVGFGQIRAKYTVIRHSLYDGVRFDSNGRGIVLNSQIVDNAQYGMRNTQPVRAVLATNNWWGDPNGPKTDTPACSPGSGDEVTDGVLFRPVLTDSVTTRAFPLSDAPILTLSPRRWFAPANGATRVYFDITLRDPNGAPLPGRMVRLNSTLGTVVDGGITSAGGKTLAYLTSNSPGNADVTAALDAANTCEGAMSPTSKITFTPPLDITDLMPNSAAPYVNDDIVILPKPTVVGITSTLTAQLTNPYTLPVTVDVTFDYVQSSIGLVFGPVADLPGVVIPADSTLTITAPWVPSVSGHYCFQVTYDIISIGDLTRRAPQSGSSGRGQVNTDSLSGGLLDAVTKAPLQQAENALSAVNWFIDQAADTDPFGIPLYLAQQHITWMMVQAAEISQNLVGDPPRQDYTSLAIPARIALPPVTPPVGVSPALAAAMENLRQSLADVVYAGRGSTTSLDRYGGASAAKDVLWSSQQSNAMLYYDVQFGSALITATQAISGFYQVLEAENIPDDFITVSEVITYQNRLSTQGFSAIELAGYTSIGLTTGEIESLRQRYIAADPDQVAGSPRQKLLELADRLNTLGLRLLYPEVFMPSFSVSGGAGLRSEAVSSGNTLAQVYQSYTTIQLGNPLTQTATIDVRVRRVDLPADWMVSVSPAQASLAPGEQTSVTINIVPGAPVPQGIIPRVAIEGYVGDLLLGGVAVEVVVPKYVNFDGKLRLYLPIVVR